MKIERRPVNDGVLRLAVTGEIDLATADDLYEAITTSASLPDTAELVIDLADVTFCDSTGISTLIRARAAATEFGVIVTVINPLGVVQSMDLRTPARDSAGNLELHYNYRRPRGPLDGSSPASATPSRVNNVLALHS